MYYIINGMINQLINNKLEKWNLSHIVLQLHQTIIIIKNIRLFLVY